MDLSLELPRTWAAWAQFAAVAPRLTMASGGDGHPVLVLPGFLASDLSTVPLRRFLRRLGYRTYGWSLGRNLGATSAIIDGLIRHLHEIRRSQARTVSIVGWSLGGVFGRELARRFPDAVRQVVSLGSPFNSSFNGLVVRGLGTAPEPLPLPSTAVYTRTDGIVDWRTTVQRPDERSENVEVRGSHCGLGLNRAAVLAIADRLAQPEGVWAPFRPPDAFRHWYPRPWPDDESDDEPGDEAVPVETVPAEERSWTG